MDKINKEESLSIFIPVLMKENKNKNMKIKCVITNIDWDTDGEEIKELPKDVTFEINYDEEYGAELDQEVADELSDRYGFCVNTFYSIYYDEDGIVLDNCGLKVNDISNASGYYYDEKALEKAVKEFDEKLKDGIGIVSRSGSGIFVMHDGENVVMYNDEFEKAVKKEILDEIHRLDSDNDNID